MTTRQIRLGFLPDRMQMLADCDPATQEEGFRILTQQLATGEVVVASWTKPAAQQHTQLAIRSSGRLAYVVLGVVDRRCTDLRFFAALDAEAPAEPKTADPYDELFGTR